MPEIISPIDGQPAYAFDLLDDAAVGRRLDTNAEEITRMMGKPLGQARGEFEGTMVERVEHLCEIAAEALSDEVLPEREGFRRFIRHEPVGVVLDIAAWNYPLAIAVNVIVPAILAGDAVLVKHASQTTLVADQFARAFAEAGAPEELPPTTAAALATTTMHAR